jgi:putative acetyltransferase
MENIYTERLLLTPWRVCIEDAKGLYAYAKDPDVGPNAGWKPHESVEESLKIIEELFVAEKNTWAIREKESNKIVGSISLLFDRRREDVNSREMGYSLAKDCWGKGYMTEAARALMDYGFEKYNLVVMSICTSPANKRSQRVIEKCGFKYEGLQRRGYHIYDGSDRDNLMFSILREEWEEIRNNR